MDKRTVVHLGNFKLDKFDKEYDFFVIKATQEELDEIQEHKNKKILEVLKDKYLPIDLDNIYLIGDGHKNGSAYRVADILKKKFFNKREKTQVHFRDYERTEEQQQSLEHLINICPDAVMSWYSALRKVGYMVYARESALGRRYKDRNDNLTCNIIIWKQEINN